MIGLIHAYLIWIGDILVLYAQCGLLLYFFRNLRPATLIIWGILRFWSWCRSTWGSRRWRDSMKAAAERVGSRKLPARSRTMRTNSLPRPGTRGSASTSRPHPNRTKRIGKRKWHAYRGNYRGIVKFRAGFLIFLHTIGTVLFGLIFAATGRMLIGMGLMKLGVFSGQRSREFYIGLVAIGYGVGLPLIAFDAFELIRHQFSHDYELHGGTFYNAYGSIVVALGHVGMLILVVKSGALSWLTRRLAAVGRMALSNYLTHSLVCTTLFYGYGFGLYGRVNRTGLAAIVFTIWVAQL